MMHRKSLLLMLMGLCLVVLLAACGGQPEEAAAPTTAAEPEATIVDDYGPAPTEEAEVEEPPMTSANAVTVADQSLGEGDSVTIAEVVSDVPGWIVIHTQADGGPGPIIGFAPVAAGENSQVVVTIDAAAATETLYAMLHIDAGVTGEYEFPGPDAPAMDAAGNVVTPPFQLLATGVAVENSVTVSDQMLGADGTVMIDEVVSNGPGWLVIHIQADGGPGPIIGFAPVKDGLNSAVPVEIDAGMATETLYAMLHIDAGVTGEYEFPGPDAPATDAAGNVVTPPFTLSGVNQVWVSDQALSADNSVTIDLVYSEGSGWLVIHAEANGGPGPVLGQTQVVPGWNAAVVVAVDPAGVTDTLYAMLHIDAGTAGVYEFPGEDGPAVDPAGNVVTPPFNLTAEDAQSDSEAATATVRLRDFAFGPEALTVPVGSRVNWVNEDGFGHTVTSDDDLFGSGTLGETDTFAFTFDTAGVYHYYCRFHGGAGGAGMSGTVEVTP